MRFDVHCNVRDGATISPSSRAGDNDQRSEDAEDFPYKPPHILALQRNVSRHATNSSEGSPETEPRIERVADSGVKSGAAHSLGGCSPMGHVFGLWSTYLA
jgi:hypothetical protein